MENYSDPTDNKLRKILDVTSQEENYPVPEAYFEEFSSRVQEQIHQRAAKTKRFRLFFPGYRIVLPAGALCIALTCWWVFSREEQKLPLTTAPVIQLPISAGDVKELIAETVQQADERELMSEAAIAKISDEYLISTLEEMPSSEKKNASLAKLSDEELETYILENAAIDEL